MIAPTLALDYGTQRIGVAVSQASLAVPLRVVPHDQELWPVLEELVAKHQVEQVLVGLSEGEMAVQTKKFAAQVEQRLERPVQLVDETLSSQVAQEKLATAKRSKRVGPIDHYAAAEFLQEWLDLQGSEHRGSTNHAKI